MKLSPLARVRHDSSGRIAPAGRSGGFTGRRR